MKSAIACVFAVLISACVALNYPPVKMYKKYPMKQQPGPYHSRKMYGHNSGRQEKSQYPEHYPSQYPSGGTGGDNYQFGNGYPFSGGQGQGYPLTGGQGQGYPLTGGQGQGYPFSGGQGQYQYPGQYQNQYPSGGFQGNYPFENEYEGGMMGGMFGPKGGKPSKRSRLY